MSDRRVVVIQHEGNIVRGTFGFEDGILSVKCERQEWRTYLAPGDRPEPAARRVLQEMAASWVRPESEEPVADSGGTNP